jgi:8-oxo-dGTP pyrophosphatase MutT (NUDIX family)
VSAQIERLISRLALRDTIPPQDGRRHAAVAVVLHDGRVLLMKRTARVDDPWSGHISLPGGGYHASDRDLLATAMRETREELAIDLAGARVLGVLSALSTLAGLPQSMDVTPCVFLLEQPVEPQPGPEAEAAFWLPLELAASGALDETYTYPGTQRTFPAWGFERHVIWGLTYRILGDLLALAR